MVGGKGKEDLSTRGAGPITWPSRVAFAESARRLAVRLGALLMSTPVSCHPVSAMDRAELSTHDSKEPVMAWAVSFDLGALDQ